MLIGFHNTPKEKISQNTDAKKNLNQFQIIEVRSVLRKREELKFRIRIQIMKVVFKL